MIAFALAGCFVHMSKESRLWSLEPEARVYTPAPRGGTVTEER